ncbi:PI-PLC X domain-containing protein At5g67130-like [Wolffia australiana]
MGSKLVLYLFLGFSMGAASLFEPASSCSNQSCQLLDSCSSTSDCATGLLCSNCPALGKNQSTCVPGQATNPASIVKGLPFNKYSWIVTHNAFSILEEPSLTGTSRVTFYNQEDSVTNQLKNGVRGLMLDTYDFMGDIWLCHSFGGQCYNFTAFEPAINTLKEVEAFLSGNPSEIVTIILQDSVRTNKGLTKLFTNAGLMKYWYPVSEMPVNGRDWPTITEMISKNHRLLVFSSNSSKEADEGIAYQWRYLLENGPGDPGLKPGACPNREESQRLDSRNASLILMNYFHTNPNQNNAYLFDGGAVFNVMNRINGQTLCGCSTVTSCKEGSSFGICKSSGTSLLKRLNISLSLFLGLLLAFLPLSL